MSEIAAPFAAALGGFVVGMLAFSRVVHWVVAILSASRASANEARSRIARVGSAVLLSAGPWFLGAVAILAYYVHSRPWAIWAYAGFVVAVLFFLLLSMYFDRKAGSRAA